MRYFITIISSIALLAALLYWQHNESSAKGEAAFTGPILYGMTGLGGQLYKIDVMNCTFCPIATLTGFTETVADLLVLPNGDILLQTENGLFRYTLPSTTPIWSGSGFYGGSILGVNGIVYLSNFGTTPTGLFSFDPTTNTTTFVGPWPPIITVVDEFFYQNGILYAFARQGPPPLNTPVILEVNLTNPAASVVVQVTPSTGSGGLANGGYTTQFSGNDLYQYNVATNSLDLICDFPFIGGDSFLGLTDLPSGIAELPCQCLTNAGTGNNNTFNICVPGNVTVPYNNNAVLDGNDILRYILFSDLNDPVGSIIVQSSSAIINFNSATMQTGVIYYLATIAGNNQSGNVNLSDPCFDISNTVAQVVWQPRPTVVFNVSNPNLCAGECRTVTATFTGTPPFNLTYTTTAGTVTQVFTANTGSFQVCAPAGAAIGVLGVQATNLTDAWCGCL